MRRLLVAATILILNVGCYKEPITNTTSATYSKETISQKCPLKPFKSIALNGNTTIELVNGPYAASFSGMAKDLDGRQVQINNGVLSVASPAYANNTAIKIFAPNLKNISVSDHATVKTKNFKTAGLTISAKDNGTINLEGKYNINKISQRGNGRITISWINSNNLFIDSDSSGPIYLAGTANNVVAKLINDARLDARYLRTQKASIFTTDDARADVLVLDTLGAFAVDNSNIYHYKRPPNITVVTKDYGNVLQPDWIH